MLVDLRQKFVSIDGRILKDVSVTEDEKGVKAQIVTDLTLERVVNLALAEPIDQKMSGDTKIKCFDLLLRVIAHKGGIVELEAKDVAFIKTLIKPKFSVLVVGEAMCMLEGQGSGIEIIKNEKLDPPEGVDEDKPDLPPTKLEDVVKKDVPEKDVPEIVEPPKSDPEPEPDVPENDENKQEEPAV